MFTVWFVTWIGIGFRVTRKSLIFWGGGKLHFFLRKSNVEKKT